MNEKDFLPIFKELRRQGWRLEQTNNGHYKAYPPNQEASLVCFATSSGDPRAIKNALSELIRSGFQVQQYWQAGKRRDMAANIRHSSATPEHFTPPNVIAAASGVMGGIDLDPATTARANEYMVMASNFFTLKENGFTKPWHGRVFLNPPGGFCNNQGIPCKAGGNSAAKAWWFKLAREYKEGRVMTAVFIGFSIELLQTTQVDARLTGGDWTIPIPLDFPICIPSRRLRFWGDTGKSKVNTFVESSSPTHANVIVYLPEIFDKASRRRFEAQFGDIGRIVWPEGKRNPR